MAYQDKNQNREEDKELPMLDVCILLFLFLLMYFSFIFLQAYSLLKGQELEITLSHIGKIFFKKHNKSRVHNYQESHYTLSSFTIENDELIKNKIQKKA
jgi:hypothetical protein